jgi:putative endonuclease
VVGGTSVDRQQLGRDAEQAAAGFLESQQCAILLRNYRCRMGELDIVAQAPDGTLIIAEVRLRSRRNYGGGAASVDFRKQQRLVRASRHLLATHASWNRCALRFDVLDLRPAAPGALVVQSGYEVEWIRHAFSL